MGFNKNFGRADTHYNIAYAPKPLNVGGVEIYTNDPEIYHANGWYDVVIKEKPEEREGYIIVPNWRNSVGQTVTNFWKYEVAPEPVPTEIELLRDDVTELQSDVSSHDELLDTIMDQLTEQMITLCLLELGLDDFDLEE